jgi:hypothetical protein
MLDRMKAALTDWARKAGRGFEDDTDSAFVWDETKMTKTVSIDVDRETETGPKFLNIEGRYLEILRVHVEDTSVILAGGSVVEDPHCNKFITAIRGAPVHLLNRCLNDLWNAGYRLVSRTIDHELITKVTDSETPTGHRDGLSNLPLSQARSCGRLF